MQVTPQLDIASYFERMAREHSDEYNSKKQEKRREHQKAYLHGVREYVSNCSDGRVQYLRAHNLVESPRIRLVRNIGGNASLGWSTLEKRLTGWVGYIAKMDPKKVRPLSVTGCYHTSLSNPSLGCAGYECDVDRAREAQEEFVREIQLLYGKKTFSSEVSERMRKCQLVHPRVIGIDTDTDAIIYHGKDGKSFNALDLIGQRECEGGSRSEKDFFLQKASELYYDQQQHPDVIHFYAELMKRNVTQVREVLKAKRPIQELQHGEHSIVIGPSGWVANKPEVLTVNDGSLDVRFYLLRAITIIENNIREGHVKKDQGGICIVIPYDADPWGRPVEEDYQRARLALAELSSLVGRVLKYECEGMRRYFRLYCAVMNRMTTVHTRYTQYEY